MVNSSQGANSELDVNLAWKSLLHPPVVQTQGCLDARYVPCAIMKVLIMTMLSPVTH